VELEHDIPLDLKARRGWALPSLNWLRRIPRRRWVVLATQTAIAALVLVLWQYLPEIGALRSRGRVFDPFFISSPQRVGNRLIDLFTGRNGSVLIWSYMRPTVESSLLGTAIGMGLGVAFGLICSNFRFLDDVCRPFLVAANAVPRIALIPLIVLLFGPTFKATIIVAVIVVFFVAFFNAYEGGRTVAPEVVANAVLLGGGRWAVLRRVRLPYVLAWTMAVLPLGVTIAVISVVTAEILTGYPGLGSLLVTATVSADASLTFAVVIVLAALGVTIVLLADVLKRRVLHWWGK
jgi:sulfonate transport system permease protein